MLRVFLQTQVSTYNEKQTIADQLFPSPGNSTRVMNELIAKLVEKHFTVAGLWDF